MDKRDLEQNSLNKNSEQNLSNQFAKNEFDDEFEGQFKDKFENYELDNVKTLAENSKVLPAVDFAEQDDISKGKIEVNITEPQINGASSNQQQEADSTLAELESAPARETADAVNDAVAPLKSGDAGEQSQNKYDIKNYDNPYELLLAIMDDKKVDLKTVVLSEITDEYLEYIRQSDTFDLDQASDFLAVAATLLEIKVKALLPKPEEPKDDELDPEKELLRKIEEYKIMKEAAEELKAIEDIDRFYKAPDESVNDYRYVLKQMNMDNLLNAFTKMMIKLQQKTTISKERKIEKDRFTVAEKIFSIKVIMNEREQMHFSEMFDEDYTKSEVISTFQAMLELMKLQFLKVQQNSLFDDILLIKNPDYVEGQNDATIDDYDEG